jgi:hypothetical protein
MSRKLPLYLLRFFKKAFITLKNIFSGYTKKFVGKFSQKLVNWFESVAKLGTFREADRNFW